MVLTLVLATQILVIAHRAEHLHHGENSIPAIQSAIQLGVDYVELDVRTTQDGKLSHLTFGVARSHQHLLCVKSLRERDLGGNPQASVRSKI